MPKTPEKELDFICAGHLCLDITPGMEHLEIKSLGDTLHPGTLLKTGRISFSCGGSVNNTGQALRSLGHTVFFSALVGDDILGHIVTETLEKNGDTGGIKKNRELSTSYSIVLAPKGMDRTFLHHAGANEHFSIDNVDFDKVKKAKHFHFGYPPLMKKLYHENGRELIELFEKIKGEGLSTSLDLAMVKPDDECFSEDWRMIFSELLPHVDFFVPSIEETLLLWNPEKYVVLRNRFNGDIIEHIDMEIFRSLASDFIAMGCGAVMLKAGSQGLYFKTGTEKRLSQCPSLKKLNRITDWVNREIWCPPVPPERFVSTTATGDVCIAGFLSAMISGAGCLDSILAGAYSASLRIAEKEINDALPLINKCLEMIRNRKVIPEAKSMGKRLSEPDWILDNSTNTYYYKKDVN